MISLLTHVWQALLMSAAMAWQVAWSLVLGFALSALVQTVISKEQMRRHLGGSGVREIALATFYGAASSSCSYAAASMSRALFQKGAALTPSLAFLFSSTNLVVELGVILYVLMGWQFTAAEWLGGLLLVAILSIAVRLTYPAKLVEEARTRAQRNNPEEPESSLSADRPLLAKLRDPQTKALVAGRMTMEFSMLRDDLIVGFLVAGAIAVFVPASVWQVLFFAHSAPWVQTLLGAFVGALLAIVTFVCSIGNVPMAAVLWSIGMPFSGALAFLYADLIVLPLLDVYRKYYGWRMALYIFGIFFCTMVLAALAMSWLFGALHLIPAVRPDPRAFVEHFSFNYTFWLNLAAAAIVVYVAHLNRTASAEPETPCCHD